MCRTMRNPSEFNIRRYDSCVIDINEYVTVFPRGNLYDIIGEMELNEIMLNSMQKNWIKHTYIQGFDCETITFKNL